MSLLLLALALLVPVPARAAEAKDLSGQFPDPACRDQGALRACHSFASVALVEAAVFRQYGAVGKGGTRLELSEGDLFVRRTVADSGYFLEIASALDQKADVGYALNKAEGDKFPDGAAFALAHGIAAAATVPFDVITKRYEAYKARVKTVLASKLAACGVPPNAPGALSAAVAQAPWASGAADQAAKELDAGSEEIAQGYSDTMSSVKLSQLKYAQVQCQKAQLETTALASFVKYIEKAAGQKSREAETLLLGDIAGLDEERAWVLGLLKGFTLDKASYTKAAPALRGDLAACRSSGAAQRAFLLKRLRQGVPVGVSMNLAGLAEWNRAKVKSDSWHAFVVTGYELAGGALTLKTRNSWGGLNPDVPEDRLCRVRLAAALLTDQEK